MISGLAWVPPGVAAHIPKKVGVSAAEMAMIQAEEAKAEETKQARQAANRLKMEQMDPAQAKIMAEYGLDNYSDEEEESYNFTPNDLVYKRDEVDPTIGEVGSEDEEDLEDFLFKDTDAMLVVSRVSEEASSLEVHLYDRVEQTLFVHHDIMLPTMPLSLTRVSLHPGSTPEAPKSGNLMAMSSFLPGIEIWDLDVVDAVEPIAVLGGFNYNAPTVPGKKKSGRKTLRGGSSGEPPLFSWSHTDAVLGMDCNRVHTNILASASADGSVRLWDITRAAPPGEGAMGTSTEEGPSPLIHAWENMASGHKMQAAVWNPTQASMLLTGAFGGVVSWCDMRSPADVTSLKLHETLGDVEDAKWYNEHCFLASGATGALVLYDVRNTTKPVFTLEAHDGACSAIGVSPSCPGLVVTGGADGFGKVWDFSKGTPDLVLRKEARVGKVFGIDFIPGSPFSMAATGSKGIINMWELGNESRVLSTFGDRVDGEWEADETDDEMDALVRKMEAVAGTEENANSDDDA